MAINTNNTATTTTKAISPINYFPGCAVATKGIVFGRATKDSVETKNGKHSVGIALNKKGSETLFLNAFVAEPVAKGTAAFFVGYINDPKKEGDNSTLNGRVVEANSKHGVMEENGHWYYTFEGVIANVSTETLVREGKEDTTVLKVTLDNEKVVNFYGDRAVKLADKLVVGTKITGFGTSKGGKFINASKFLILANAEASDEVVEADATGDALVPSDEKDGELPF